MKKKKLKKIVRAELSRMVKVLLEVMRAKPSLDVETMDKLLGQILLPDIAKAFKSDVSLDELIWPEEPARNSKITNLDVTGLGK